MGGFRIRTSVSDGSRANGTSLQTERGQDEKDYTNVQMRMNDCESSEIAASWIPIDVVVIPHVLSCTKSAGTRGRC